MISCYKLPLKIQNPCYNTIYKILVSVYNSGGVITMKRKIYKELTL